MNRPVLVFGTCSLALAFTFPRTAVEPNENQSPDSSFAAVERAARADMQRLGIPGMTIAFVDGGRITWSHAIGFANAETQAPMKPEMLFRVGSVSKVVAALAVVAEARARGIPLDAPIGRYLPTLEPAVGRVTLDQLLSFRGGIIDVITASPIADRPNEDELVSQIYTWSDSLFFGEPGEVESYSNIGYALAGAFIEAVSGKRFSTIAAERVLRPLGLNDATFSHVEAMRHPFADGHVGPPNAPPTLERTIRTDARYLPPTFLWASAPDIARLEIALMDHGKIDGRQALDSSIVDLVMQTHATVPLDGSGYTYGLFVHDDPTGRRYTYVGRAEGYRTIIGMASSVRRGFVVMVNRFDAMPTATLTALGALVTPDRRAEATRIDSTAAMPAGIAGHYANGAWSFDIVRAMAGGYEFHGRLSPQSEAPISVRIVPAGVDRIALAMENVETHRTTFTPAVVIRDRTGVVKYLYIGERAARRIIQQLK